MRSAATRSSTRKTRLDGHDRSPECGHELVTVDLFQGWTPSAGSSDEAEVQSDQIDPALSHDDPSSLATSADAPSFKSIGFPTNSLPPSLSTEGSVAQHDAGDEAEVKKIAPSKRPGVSHAKKTAPDHIKRPRNAYIIFRSHIVSQKLIPKEVEHDHRNISRIIAHMWKSLAQEDRAHYEKIAHEEKERHKQLFPNYRYQPTTRRTNVNKRNVKKLENGDEECQEIADIILKAQGKGGVAANPEPRKPTKRAREATRPQQENDTESAAEPSPRKRAKPTKAPSKVTKVTKTPKTQNVAKGTHGNGDANESEQTLETVFLYHSSSPSPSVSSCSSAAIASVAVTSPEPLQLSPETPPAARQGAHGDEQGAGASIFGRRASSVPLVPFYSLPPPPAIALSDHEGYQASAHPQSFGVPIEREQLQSIDGQLDVVQIDQSRDYGRDMPAPAWKGRRSQPPPIPNTWQNCSFDEPSLPSPRTMGFCGTSAKHSMGRPRTAMPSTPSSASFRGFFHPWAFDHSDESTLISPMNVSFQDGRRRSSIIRHGSLTGRRYGSFGLEPPSSFSSRAEPADLGCGGRMDAYPSDLDFFEHAANAASVSFREQGLSSGADEAVPFAFDPALEGEGCAPMPGHPLTSPRPSFSESTLAAAARDWTSIKDRKGRHSPSAAHQPQPQSEPAPEPQFPTQAQDAGNLTLEESVERAVLLALGKHFGQDVDCAERSSKIVQQILSSFTSQSSNQPQASQSVDAEQGTVLERHNGANTAAPALDLNRRASLRGSCTPAGSFRSSPGLNSVKAVDGRRSSKALPSPLHLARSNQQLAADSHAHPYPTSQHCI
ncbi:HMG-box transcription factor [Moesziomyces antarcticus T-34]|uniref:HMG-box transcription factor n=1 Tax=Pseudozyma antarctica (strain T-34) TaxID=1151754 RepID=M9MCH3_PSEA3|nr:HMG-box transcription factor [Moesziomyces antarcticus T-34]